MAYAEEGPSDGPVVLMLHGEPSWSFLYRKMIPTLVSSGFRVICPDLIGLGRSDKPLKRSDYTYARHIDWIQQFIGLLDLKQISLFVQDWGSLIGLRVVADAKFTWRFARIALGNGGLPTGQATTKGFSRWRAFVEKIQDSDDMPIARLVAGGTVNGLSAAEENAYSAPFPTVESQVCCKVFPLLVPYKPDDPEGLNNARALEYLSKLRIPFLLVFSDSDMITRGGEKVFENFEGVKMASHLHHKIKAAGHFLQEDKGEELAQRLVQFIHHTAPSKL
eukprot:TRINITY_DN12981_c0_g1_i1.p1 TRINITY_DN12981_c0_g1~~TRINITY_DN12981_c0_g1_i1.p1  ORF type:complete len:318 (-),score=59.77 TRINITY_DN12981_c0_g1_i1:41-871(-)